MTQQTSTTPGINVVGSGVLLTLPQSVFLDDCSGALPDYISFFSMSEMAEWLNEHGYKWIILVRDKSIGDIEPLLFIPSVKAARHFIAQFGSETTLQTWTEEIFDYGEAGEWVQT